MSQGPSRLPLENLYFLELRQYFINLHVWYTKMKLRISAFYRCMSCRSLIRNRSARRKVRLVSYGDSFFSLKFVLNLSVLCQYFMKFNVWYLKTKLVSRAFYRCLYCRNLKRIGCTRRKVRFGILWRLILLLKICTQIIISPSIL